MINTIFTWVFITKHPEQEIEINEQESLSSGIQLFPLCPRNPAVCNSLTSIWELQHQANDRHIQDVFTKMHLKWFGLFPENGLNNSAKNILLQTCLYCGYPRMGLTSWNENWKQIKNCIFHTIMDSLSGGIRKRMTQGENIMQSWSSWSDPDPMLTLNHTCILHTSPTKGLPSPTIEIIFLDQESCQDLIRAAIFGPP